MKDFNFFSSFQKQETTLRHRRLFVFACLFLFILVIGGVYMLVFTEAERIDIQVYDLNQQLRSPELSNKLMQVRKDRDELQVVQGYYGALEAVIIDLRQGDIVNTSFIEAVNGVIPGEVVLRNMTFSQAALTLNADADSRVTIAEFFHNMVGLGLFHEVHIGTITENEVTVEALEEEEDAPVLYEYAFSMQCVIKGGVAR